MTDSDTAEIAALVHSLAILAERPKFLRDLVLSPYGGVLGHRARRLPLPLVDTVPRGEAKREY